MFIVSSRAVLFYVICINSVLQTINCEAGNTAHCYSTNSKYEKVCDKVELTDEEMFKRGHMRPFGSHRPPDHVADEIPFMISPEDFYMNYVVKHRPVVLKGEFKLYGLQSPNTTIFPVM